jgi:hypothetical protein
MEWGRRSGDTTTTPAGRFGTHALSRPTRFNGRLPAWFLLNLIEWGRRWGLGGMLATTPAGRFVLSPASRPTRLNEAWLGAFQTGNAAPAEMIAGAASGRKDRLNSKQYKVHLALDFSERKETPDGAAASWHATDDERGPQDAFLSRRPTTHHQPGQNKRTHGIPPGRVAATDKAARLA